MLLRKFLLFLFILVGIFLVFGCSSTKPPPSPTQLPTNIPYSPAPKISQTPKDDQTPVSIQCDKVSIANPAATYCTMLGYQYEIITTNKGDIGNCIFPDNSSCDAWAFLTGKCGEEFSYCARQKLDIKTISEGGDPFSQEYAVCINKEGSIIGTVSDLSGLSELWNTCSNK